MADTKTDTKTYAPDTKIDTKNDTKNDTKKETKNEANMGSIYREMPEPSGLVFRILSEYPGIPEEIASELMSWVEYRGALSAIKMTGRVV